MAQELEPYASREVRLVFLGQVITGLADTYMTAQRNEDLKSYKEGADGSVGISVSPSRTGMVELTVDQSAPINILLSVVVAKEQQEGKVYRGAFSYSDKSGAAVASFAKVSIKAAPSLVGAKERTDRTWMLFVEEFDFLSVPKGLAKGSSLVAQVDAALNSLDSLT